ncbi:MAG: ABC transporter substrate-binding protein [Defluviitaleaceae bacterium]|nr:ABC transporter substrate-binding protein [Defluviitaleaceae bacterium]
MKKIFITFALIFATFTFAACGVAEMGAAVQPPVQTATETPDPPAVTYVTITDFDGNIVTVRQNPTTVAIYDQGILDMLYAVGFERTGIERLIIPNPTGMPDVLGWFRYGNENVQVVNGGTLFYVNWDVLDLMEPELVILGARSFGMNAAEERLPADEVERFRADTEERYANTSFIRLTINATQSDLLNNMRDNAYALAQIFPAIGYDLFVHIYEIEAEMAAIAAFNQSTDLTTVFVMMTTPTSFSVFLEGSRKGFMFYEFGFNSLEMDLVAWSDQHGFDAQSEFLLEQNPDVIFLLDRTEPLTGLGAATENFLNDPIIQQTNAYINGHIYSGLPMAEWYTVVGGIASSRRMIEDVNRFVDAHR